MRVNDQHVTFNVVEVIKSLDDFEDCNSVNIVDIVIIERLNSCCSKEEINTAIFEELEDE